MSGPRADFCHLWCAAAGGPGRSDTLGPYSADLWSYPMLQPTAGGQLSTRVQQFSRKAQHSSSCMIHYDFLPAFIMAGMYVMAALSMKSVYDKVPGTHNSLLQSNSLLSFPILFLSHFENWLVLCLQTRSEIATTITSSTHHE